MVVVRVGVEGLAEILHRGGVQLAVFLGQADDLVAADGKIAAVELQRYIFFLEARQVNVKLVAVVCFTDIGLHHVLCVLAVKGIVLAEH